MSVKRFLSCFLSFIVFSLGNVLCASTLIAPHSNQYISYNEVGQGKPLVFIHAFPTDQRLWQPQQETLKQHFHVITLDLWGFSQSSGVEGEAISMGEYADEVKQLLDSLNIDNAIIVGESMGGYIALAFLQKYPNQTAGLVLSNTQSIADSQETRDTREKTAVDVLKNGTDNLIASFMSKALSTNASEKLKAYLQHILKLQSATGIASALRGMALRSDTSELLATTTVPVLILTGELDKVISPQQSTEMHMLTKNSRLIILPNAGHLSNLEQSGLWNQAVIDMFA